MGLDMYIEKRKTRYKEGTIFGHIVDVDEGGYFRKFNALHGFIVQNFADGADDCSPIYLHEEFIQTILETLREVNEDNSLADELLPTTGGFFFFGSYEYDEWYFSEVKKAIKIFEDLLVFLQEETPEGEYRDVVYQASW